MSDAAAPFVKYVKTFKKYKEEFAPEVVDYVRGWARTEKLIDFIEDKSIVKVTGSKEQITVLLATLKDRFGYIPPEMREGAKKDDGTAAE